MLNITDRFTRGFWAGILAGIPAITYNLIVYYLGLSTLRWADFAIILTIGRKPVNTAELIFGLLIIIFFLAFLGTVFIYLLKIINSRNLFLKGWCFSAAVWFFSYAVTYLFKIPELAFIPLKTAIQNLTGASVWGISLAYALILLDKRKT